MTASGYAGARRHPRLGALCVAFATFGFARTSAAEPDIEWDAPAECPSAEDARRAVARLIEPSRVSQLRLMFRSRRAGSVWIAELRTPGGTRTLRGETCREVVDAAVVIWALAVGANPPEPQETPDGESEAPVPQSPPRPASPPAGASSRRRVGPSLEAPPNGPHAPTVPPSLLVRGSLRVLGDVGTLPGPSAGVAVRVRVGSRRVSCELALLGLLPRSTRLEASPSRGADLYWFSGQVAGCAAPLTDASLTTCFGIEAGRLTGEGFGIDHPATEHAFWLAPTASLIQRLISARSFRLELGASLAVPALRPEFVLDQWGTVHRPAAASARLELGIGWQ